ncbi:hypothetical protein ABIA06_002980 [Bradyrhizobium yuanmingense]|uniref:hypothetical protein n=1 Tax=Bradyrhizobium yuanmingense TaxID=108015 RepID=UPI00351748E4
MADATERLLADKDCLLKVLRLAQPQAPRPWRSKLLPLNRWAVLAAQFSLKICRACDVP